MTPPNLSSLLAAATPGPWTHSETHNEVNAADGPIAAVTRGEWGDEIAALEALTPVGRFAMKTAGTIEIQVDALKHGVDETSIEWEEMGDEMQMAAMDAFNWREGYNDERPSQGWGGLVK